MSQKLRWGVHPIENPFQRVQISGSDFYAHPALVLMDVVIPLLNGLQANCQILKANPAAKVLILSVHSDRRARHRRWFVPIGAEGLLSGAKNRDQSVLGQMGLMFFWNWESHQYNNQRREPKVWEPTKAKLGVGSGV
jgi:hypothetical protein